MNRGIMHGVIASSILKDVAIVANITDDELAASLVLGGGELLDAFNGGIDEAIADFNLTGGNLIQIFSPEPTPEAIIPVLTLTGASYPIQITINEIDIGTDSLEPALTLTGASYPIQITINEIDIGTDSMVPSLVLTGALMQVNANYINLDDEIDMDNLDVLFTVTGGTLI